MQKVSLNFLAIVILTVFTIISCGKEDPIIDPGPNPNPSGLSFQEVINSGGSIQAPTVSEDSDTTNVDNNLPIGDGTYNCTTISYDVNAASGGSSGFPLFNPTADVIYPGSMLQGNSLHQATPNPIVVERAGGSISTDILDGNQVSSFEVDQVKKSTITDGINNIIASSTGTLPANFNLKVESIQSREEFALELGVDVNSAFLDIESRLDYSYNSEKSAFMVTLNQSYYTMSFDLPTSLDKLFAPSVTPEQLANYVGENNPATYISSVNYGRIFYLLIESTSTQHELEIAVDGAFSGVTTDVDATLDIDYFNDVENVTYSVFAYGGDATPTFDAVGVTDINSLIDVLKQSTSLESAKPLSYVVRNVSNNQIVATQLATTYDVVECEQVGTVGTLPQIAHWTNHPAINELGPITAAYANSSDNFILMNEQGDWVKSTVQANGEGLLEGPFPSSDWVGLPFTSVGAACRIGGPNTGLYVFNEQGNKYAVYQTNGAWTVVHDISEFHAGDCPFINTGAGAMAYIGYIPNTSGIFNSNPFGESHFMFDQSGENYAQSGLDVINPAYSNFYPTNNVQTGFGLGGKISEVGAAIGFQNGGSSGTTRVHILFDKSGTQYAVWGDFGNGTEVIGPFGI